jgi:ATP-dependent Clp protease ATP-binding subunit ClpC
MFERYTEPARRVIFFGRYMASQTGSPIIETEHLLLGLLREDKGLAQRFLGSPWAAEEVWKRIQQSKPAGKKTPGPVDLPISNECKRVLSFAAEEAEQLSSKHIETEDLLLGLLREEKCLAAQVLHERGVLLSSVREDLIRVPHGSSATQEFVRAPRQLPADVVEGQDRLKTIVKRMEEAKEATTLRRLVLAQTKSAGSATSWFCCINSTDSTTGFSIESSDSS